MRTHKEFREEFLKAHDCEKCHGKIVGISLDNVGVTRCAYCNEVVSYPNPTREELEAWMKEDKDGAG